MATDTPNPTDLASAISARICHDLVSPVGAIVNGIDLVSEIGAAGIEDEIAMIGQSATRASGLLQFYRIAFGAAPPDTQGIGRAVLRDQALSVINWQRVTLDWPSTNGPPLPRAEAKLLCLLLLCARSVTGMAGVIQVVLHESASLPIEVIVVGDGAPDADARLALLSEASLTVQPTARLVEFALARSTAGVSGVQIETTRTPGFINLRTIQA